MPALGGASNSRGVHVHRSDDPVGRFGPANAPVQDLERAVVVNAGRLHVIVSHPQRALGSLPTAVCPRGGHR